MSFQLGTRAKYFLTLNHVTYLYLLPIMYFYMCTLETIV